MIRASRLVSTRIHGRRHGVLVCIPVRAFFLASMLTTAVAIASVESVENDSTALERSSCEPQFETNSDADESPVAGDGRCLATDTNTSAGDEVDNPGQRSSENRMAVSTEIAENTQDASLLRHLLGGRQLVFFGRLEGDYAEYGVEVLEDDSGGEVRRFRVGLAGLVPWNDNLSYKFELDLTDASSSLSSAYLRLDTRRPGAVTIGNQDVTQNLSANTGSLSQLFMEAPLPATAFSLRKRLAISYDWFGQKSGAHAMVFGKDPNNDIGHRGVAARVFYNPYRSGDGIWHVGGSYVWEKIDGTVRLASRPESHVTDLRLVDTGKFDNVKTQTHYSLELAGATGAVTGRGEIFQTTWKRQDGSRNRFIGAYWEVGYFFTGQSFRYRQGKFIRPDLLGQGAAWELGLRVSWVDLNDGDVPGGEQRNAGVALNYYPRPDLRFMLNLIQVNSEVTGGDGPLAQVRAQLNW